MKTIILVSLIIIACQPTEISKIESKVNLTILNEIDTKKMTVAIVVVDGVYNSEMMAPYDIFHHTRFRNIDSSMVVFTVAQSLDIITTFEGIRFKPDFDFTTSPRIDVLVVPSAEHSMDTDLENIKLINFVKTKGDSAKYIMSLCDGAFVLAKTGLLDGLTSTTFPADINQYKNVYPHLNVVEGVSFVHDGKAITSAGGASSYDPSMYLIALIYGDEMAIEVGNGMVLDWLSMKKSVKKIVVNL